MVGDLINATARIEALTKYYSVRALITREVLQKLASPPPSRLLDRVIVKGKSIRQRRVRYAPNADTFDNIVVPYAKAFALYQNAKFADAAARFAALASADPPSRLLTPERCAAFVKQPPEEWHGVSSSSPNSRARGSEMAS